MNIFLMVFSSSSPTPMIEWIKVEEELPDRAVLKNFGKHLTIEKVTEDDEGQYMCKAHNAHGEALHSFHVAVEGEICIILSFFKTSIGFAHLSLGSLSIQS